MRFLYLATKNAVSTRALVLFKQLIKKMRGERKMLGRIIMFIVLLVFVTIFTAMDISNLHNGIGGYIQRYPGVLYTSVVLTTVPMLGFDLRVEEGLITLIILEAVYITIYTVAYFRIRKRKKEEER